MRRGWRCPLSCSQDSADSAHRARQEHQPGRCSAAGALSRRAPRSPVRAGPSTLLTRLKFSLPPTSTWMP
jgi:hypothetical protein